MDFLEWCVEQYRGFTAAIDLEKVADLTAVDAAGQVITYSYTVVNQGNISLTGIILDDDNTDAPPAFVSGDTDGDDQLDVTETWIYEATHTVTQEEMEAGENIVNTATVDSVESDLATAVTVVIVDQTYAVGIDKIADAPHRKHDERAYRC